MNRKTPKVIIGGPESIGLDDMRAISKELSEHGAITQARRADIFFGLGEFEHECRDGTHLILAIDEKEFVYEKPMLAAAARSVQRIAILCLGSSEALRRHVPFIKSGRVNLVISRSFLDNGRKSAIVGAHVPHSLVAEDIASSAREIARAVLVGWRQ